MAFLSKADYERRERAAERRMARNAEINTLTQEQHEALAELCYIRHNFHSNDAGDKLFKTGSAEFDEYWDLIGEINTSKYWIDSMLVDAGLPKLGFICDFCDYTNDQDFNDIEIVDRNGKVYPVGVDIMTEEELYYDKYEAARAELYELAEKWNSAVECYLTKIDEEHGTDYAPHGCQRL